MAVRWTKSDAITLGKAVANFNRKVKQLEIEGNKSLTPIDYKELKESIINRRELNRKIASLKRINEKNALELVIDEGVGLITRYEQQERKRYKTKIKRNLNLELKQIDKTKFPYKTQKEMKIENIFKHLNQYKTSSLEYFSRADLQDLRAIKYKEKYLEGLEKYANYKGYEELMKKVNSMSPNQFYKFLKAKGEIALDLKYHYYAHYSESEFQRIIYDFFDINVGENIEENDVVRDFMEIKYENR